LVANPTYATVVKAEPTSTSQCSDKLNRSLRFDGRGSAGEIQIYETVGNFVAVSGLPLRLFITTFYCKITLGVLS
jgi:hypothetical protein